LLTPSGLPLTVCHNGLGAKTSVKSPNGHTTELEYDGLNRLVKSIQPPVIDPSSGNSVNYETTYTYGENSGGIQFGRDFQPTKVVNALGFQTITEYDASFRPVNRKVEYKKASGSTPAVFAETTFGYDDVGNLTQETDPLGHITQHFYDALNRRTETKWPGLLPPFPTSRTFYTSAGLVWKTVDERDKDTLTEYDSAGRPEKVLSPEVDNGRGGRARAITQTFYDAGGNVVKTINPLGHEFEVPNNPYAWIFEYDSRNRKVKEWRPGNTLAIKWDYDNVGNMIKTTDARNYETDTAYDVANRVVKVEEPSVAISGGGSARPTTEKEYDKNGNVTRLTDPNDHDTVNTYDALNRLLTSTDAEGIVVENEYDAVGNRVAVIDGKDQRTGFAYDGLNRNTTITDALAKVTTFEYDAMNKTARVDAKSQRTEYGYDLRNRLLTVSYIDRTQDNRALSYDATGNLLAVVEATPTKSVAYTYDELKRQITETSGGLTHNYRYDLAGNRIYCLYNNELGITLVSDYDAQNRLTTLTQGTLVTTYAYDANGNVLLKTLPNGDKATSVYDEANRTSSLTGTTGANTPLYAYGYEYDAGGNVKKVTETYANTSMDRVVANAYDDINRLTTETVTGSRAATTTFGYDDANNRETMNKGGVNTAYEYNANNQLTGFTEGSRSVGFGYDGNGNRVTRTEGTATDTFAWDYENRLVGLSKASTGGIGTYAWAYDYRTRRVNLTTPTSPLTQVVFSGGTSVREIENGVPTVDYVRGSDWGGGVGGILYSLRAGVPSFTHYNRRGDVTAKTDGTGTLTYQAEYEAFGKRASETGATLDRQKSNTKDEDIPGYANEGFRFRDLESGTFLSKDPAGFVDGPNLYTYVNQNPWTKFDPNGLAEAEQNSWAQQHPILNGTINFANGMLALPKLALRPFMTTPGSREQGQAFGDLFHTATYMPGSDRNISPQQDVAAVKNMFTTPEGLGNLAGGLLLGKTAIRLSAEIGVEGLSARTTNLQTTTSVSLESAAVGTEVSRNWGGKSGPFGESWTTEPFSAQSREGLGLGRSNTGEFLSFGSITDGADLSVRQALPWDGFGGGKNEVLVPKAESKVRLDAVVMPDEPLPDKPRAREKKPEAQ